MDMSISIREDCTVKLIHEKRSVRDMVVDQVEEASTTRNGEHFYLCDLGDIIHKYKRWEHLMPRVKPFYAVKCNDEFPVLKVLSDLGASFDCSSKNEIEKVVELGISPSRIIYAHPCKQPSMLCYAEQRGVELITFDNCEELHKTKRIHPKAKLVLRMVITSINKGSYDLDSKFGCQPSEAYGLLETAQDLELNVIGISFHVGSDCREPSTFSVAIQQARNVFDIGLQLGFSMKLLDIGGGFPGDSDTLQTFHEITGHVNQALHDYFPVEEGIEIIAEPGRYIVASAAVIGVNIIARRVIPSSPINNKGKMSAACPGQDDVIMYYVNDGVYGSFSAKVIEKKLFKPQILKDATDHCYESCIWGPSCDSFDVIVETTRLALHTTGEWLYFENMGAYSLSIATNFNGMGKPRNIYYCLMKTWCKLYPEKADEYT